MLILVYHGVMHVGNLIFLAVDKKIWGKEDRIMDKTEQNPMQPYDMDALRDHVKAEMSRQGITSQKLADLTRNSKGTIDNFLNTSTVPAFDRVFAICAALGIPLDPPPEDGEEPQPEPSYGSEYVPDMKAMHQREMDALEQNHAAMLSALKEAHAAENEVREHLILAEQKQMRVWRTVALIAVGILVAICLWFVWDITGGDRGLIRYGHAVIGSLVRG